MTRIEFEQESAAVSTLCNILEQEQLCLIEAQLDKLQPLLEEKSKTIQTLSKLSQLRYKALQNAGFNSNELGMSDWVSAQQHPALQAAWLNTQQTLVKAKELNRVNGLLINKQYSKNQQKLKVLQGTSAEHQNFYGPNGQTTSQVRLGNAILG